MITHLFCLVLRVTFSYSFLLNVGETLGETLGATISLTIENLFFKFSPNVALPPVVALSLT